MKVLLVDDHALFAKSLEIALEDFSEIACMHSIKHTQNIIDEIKKLQPDIILMDINLNHISGEDGLLLTKKILVSMPEQKIVLLTGYDLPVYRYEAQKIGAKGFVSKTVEPKELVEILSDIQRGKCFFPKDTPYLEELTASEKEVLELLSTGITRKEIAGRLYLSERTVSNHLQHIFDKLQVSSAVEAIAMGTQMGYISPVQ